MFIDPDGREINVSNLSSSEQKSYNEKIQLLSSNNLFKTYYNKLISSETPYYIKSGAGAGGSGSYNPKTNEIHAVNDIETLAQELFHAYQSDLGVYTDADMSVREAEGDLVSSNIASSLNSGLAKFNEWDQGIGFNNHYMDDNYIFNEGVLSKSFDEDFNKSVNARIQFYKNREENIGAKAPKSYIQENSGVGAKALKTVVTELYKDRKIPNQE
jgi:hypothetical protein